MSSTTTPAFLIVCGKYSGAPIDPEYAKRSTSIAVQKGLKPIAGGEVGSQVKVLEGTLPEGSSFLMIEQFPSIDALNEFYYSKAYQAAIPFRSKAVQIEFIAAAGGISEVELQAWADAAAPIQRS